MSDNVRRSSLIVRVTTACSFLLVAVLWVGVRSASADPLVVTRTAPAANSVTHRAPANIVVYLARGLASASGHATVFSSSHQVVAQGVLRSAPGRPGTLTMKLAWPSQFSRGVYSVVWTVPNDSGTFAFDVEPTGTSPGSAAVLPRSKPVTTLGPLQDGLVAWLGWLTLMSFVGALALCVLVTGPVASDIDASLVASTTTRLARVAAVAIVLSALAVMISLAHHGSSDGGYAFSSIWPQLFGGVAGVVDAVQLTLTALSIGLVVPCACVAVAAGRRRRLLLGGAVTGSLALITTKVPTAAPTNWSRTGFQTVMWCGHLLAAAVWVGGLIGLLALLIPGAVPPAQRLAFWSRAIRRFSVTATSCVAALILSGLWLCWVHVDGIRQLLSTLYGRVLTVKLIAFGALLLLGGFNQFWLSPRIDALRAQDAGHRSVTLVLSRHFRPVIALEVALGLAVRLIAPFLRGSARNQAFQAEAADLTRTVRSSADKISLTPSGLQPGLTKYTVRLTRQSAHEVSMSFASRDLGVPAQQVAMRRMGAGVFEVSGLYTPQVGAWQVGVAVDERPPTRFTLPVTSKIAKLKKAPPPAVRWTTWVYGSAETLAVIVAMLIALRMSGRLARSRTIRDRATFGGPTQPKVARSGTSGLLRSKDDV
jgi:putative copper export protein/methionine-rich copper-binding protein CopC